MLNWKKEIDKVLNERWHWAREVLRENINHIGQIRQELGILEDSMENDYKLMSHFLEKRSEAKDFPEYSKFSILYAACACARIISNIRLSYPDEAETYCALYLLGCSVGSLEGFDPSQMPIDMMQDFFHSQKSKDGQNMRWQKAQAWKANIPDLQAEAKKRYEDGCTDPHHDLSNKLMKDVRFKDIPLRMIRKYVGEIAEEYGFKSGIKKNH